MVLCAQIGARRDVDDLGARRHGACGFLRQRRHRQQVDVERAAEVIRADVEELALVEQAGVVDQRGQRRQRGHHCPPRVRAAPGIPAPPERRCGPPSRR
ncbi:hypothetical protein G6F62_015445 [Rhizopus arrhizus]|nr:hypothetical protein G6F62_015445 [Rhizopus arrhizus]